MIDRNNSGIDVDDLMARIQDEVARRSIGFAPSVADSWNGEQRGFGAIEALVNTAQAKSEVRTQWSGRLNFFPFSNARVQRFFLQVLAFAFKDQRHVNLALVAAVRESIAINRELATRITVLEAAIRQLEARPLE
jgi:hypothetical protein